MLNLPLWGKNRSRRAKHGCCWCRFPQLHVSQPLLLPAVLPAADPALGPDGPAPPPAGEHTVIMLRPLQSPDVADPGWLDPFVADFRGRFMTLLAGEHLAGGCAVGDGGRQRCGAAWRRDGCGFAWV